MTTYCDKRKLPCLKCKKLGVLHARLCAKCEAEARERLKKAGLIR